MCETLKENNGKCCGECNRQVECVTCVCGTVIPSDKVVKCQFCGDVICESCGRKDWRDTGMSVCILNVCRNEATDLLASKLEAAADALRQIECLVHGERLLHDAEIDRLHTIAQDAWRATQN